eukprot:scaffold223392_cov31-Tisochrysis_lutea.AAC.2
MMFSPGPPMARQTCSITWGNISKLTPPSDADVGAGAAGAARSSGRNIGCSSNSGMDGRLEASRCRHRFSTSIIYGFLVGGKAMGLVGSGIALSFCLETTRQKPGQA